MTKLAMFFVPYCLMTIPMTSCATQDKIVKLTPLQALDVSLCSANDILPSVPAFVNTLMSSSATEVDKALSGITTGVGAVSKAVMCYLHELAIADIPSPTGHGDADTVSIDSRAKYCEESGTEFCQRPYKAAWILSSLQSRGRVVYPTITGKK